MSAAGAFGTRLAEVGLDLVGALPIAEFDALVPARWQTAEIHPTAAQWIVIASGGRALFAAFEASEFAGDGARDPLDRFVRAHVADACSDLEGARAFHYDEARRGEFADFVALGRACGLGSHGALGLSMHPEFGPWCRFVRSSELNGLWGSRAARRSLRRAWVARHPALRRVVEERYSARREISSSIPGPALRPASANRAVLTAAMPAEPVRWAPIARTLARPKPTTFGLRLPGFAPNWRLAAKSAQPDSPVGRNGPRRQGRR